MTAPTQLSERLREYAAQTVEYVRRAVGVALDFDSDTLPLLDHYLRNVPADQPATTRLIITTAAAYFGEVVVRRLGGRWETGDGDELTWRLVLPTGVSFSPAGMVGSAIVRADASDLDTGLDAPPKMRPYVEAALARMSPVSTEEYYSLCGRLDTLEHVHEVLMTVAAELAGKAVPAADDGEGDDDDGEGDGDGDDAAAPARPVVN